MTVEVEVEVQRRIDAANASRAKYLSIAFGFTYLLGGIGDAVAMGTLRKPRLHGAARATPVTEGELRSAFDQQLAAVVAGAIREQSSQLFGKLLLTAAQSPSDEERAAAYLRYRVVSNKRLDDSSHHELTRRMALPTRQAMDMLTAK